METVVLPGYGSWFPAQLGALHGLHERGEMRALKHIICTSGGALACLLYISGVGLEHVQDAMDRWSPVYDPTQLPSTWGVLTEASQLELTQIVESSWCANTGLTPGFTFAELHARYPIRITVIATDLERQAPAAFDHETHPNVAVIDAVSASVAIPFVFRPIRWGGRLYADGMLVLWSALRTFGDPRTMGVVAVCARSSQRQPVDTHLWRYAHVVLATIAQEQQILFQTAFDPQYTCEVHVPAVNFLKLPPESLRTLYTTGLAAAEARPYIH